MASNHHAALSHPTYRADIDGLRAIAVLAVVFFHAFPNWFAGGFIGVDVFFVISGYLISTIILENIEKGSFSFVEFYARRIRRIFPALILVLVASLLFGWFALLTEEFRQLSKHAAAGAGFVSNFVLWNEAGYFDNAAETKPLLHLWSLGIEEQFYIVWPMVVWLAWKSRAPLFSIILLGILISFALNMNGIHHDAVATFYSPQTRVWELLCGSLLAWLKLHPERLPVRLQLALNHVRASWVSYTGLLLLLCGFVLIDKESGFPGAWALLPVLGTMLIIMASQQAWLNRTILSHRVMVWFGLISFPLYLWHWPLLSFSRIVEGEALSLKVRVMAILLGVLLAWLTYRFIERPLRFGKNLGRKTLCLMVLMAVLGGLSLYVYHAGVMTSGGAKASQAS